jgi:hypothetical protein
MPSNSMLKGSSVTMLAAATNVFDRQNTWNVFRRHTQRLIWHVICAQLHYIPNYGPDDASGEVTYAKIEAGRS